MVVRGSGVRVVRRVESVPDDLDLVPETDGDIAEVAEILRSHSDYEASAGRRRRSAAGGAQPSVR
jgi:hypothetical protein